MRVDPSPRAASSRQLATSALPRLALYGALPPSLVPQLLPVLASEDRRAARLASYLLQVGFRSGCAGLDGVLELHMLLARRGDMRTAQY